MTTFFILLHVAVVLQAALLVSGIEIVSIDLVDINGDGDDGDVCPSIEQIQESLQIIRPFVDGLVKKKSGHSSPVHSTESKHLTTTTSLKTTSSSAERDTTSSLDIFPIATASATAT